MIRLIVLFFSRKDFFSFWIKLHRLSNRLLGIGNYKSMQISGEAFMQSYLVNQLNIQSVFDVGAHDGEYIKLLRKAGFKGPAYAFEPHPVTFQRLAKNLESDKETRLFQLALSEDYGIVKFYDRRSNSQHEGTHHATVYADVLRDLHKSDIVEYEIEKVTFDTFFPELGMEKLDLLKIDTEGHEFSVLKGAIMSLNLGTIRCIHFEFGQMNVVSRVFFKDFYDLLNKSYRIYRLLPNSIYEITNYDPETCEIFHYQNYIAIKRE